MEFPPGTWHPPVAPKLEGVYARNQILASSSLIDVVGVGPEDVLADEDGNVIAGLADGRIIRCTANGKNMETIANTGGRPLGIEQGHAGDLVICDSEKGLLSLSPNGKLQTLRRRKSASRARIGRQDVQLGISNELPGAINCDFPQFLPE